MKVGVKQLEDAIINIGSLRGLHIKYCDKWEVYRAIIEHDFERLRQISNFFYNVSGIYQTVCNYFAFLFRYDWYVFP
jgi:hypothetical protein